MKLLTSLLLSLFAVQVAAADLKVLSTNALTDVISEELAHLEKRLGSKIAIEFKPTNILLERLKGGEHADVWILGRGALIDLDKQGKIAAGTRVDIAQSGVALSIKDGVAKPDISTAEGFKQALLSAKAIASSRVGLSGLHFMSVLDRLGIADQVKPKVKIVDGGGRTAELIVRGEADMAVQLMSELLSVKGTQVVGTFPKGLDNNVVLTGGVSSAAKDPKAAKAFLDLLMEPAMLPVLKRNGMERPPAY